jgi:hypothetical protein
MAAGKRRDFLRKSAVIGAGAVAAATSISGKTEGAKRPAFKRKSPSSLELINVGYLACDPSGHLGIWGPLTNPTEGWTRRTGMVISHCWDIDKKDEERFATTYGCERVKQYDDMVDKVDAIILPSFDTAYRVNKYLIRPYLEAGIPVFINRPFAFSMADAEEIINLSRKTGTPIMCGSAYEFCKEVSIIRKAVGECSPLFGAAVTSDSSDFPSHGIHPLYWVHKIFGGDVSRISYFTQDWKKVPGAVHLEYRPKNEGETPFYVNIVLMKNTTTRSWGAMNIVGKNGGEFIDILVEESTEEVFHHFFLPSVLAMQKFFETREMPEPLEDILTKTRIFLSAWKSHVDHNGAPVDPAALPRNWKAPLMYFTRSDRYPKGFFGE